MRDIVQNEFEKYENNVSVAESRRLMAVMRRRLRQRFRDSDPLRAATGQRLHQTLPKPSNVDDAHWDPIVGRRRLLYNHNRPIIWRDLHILHHFVADNGAILPRSSTLASTRQQQHIIKAITHARRLGLFPKDFKPKSGDLMPIMDPLQYLVDNLTMRYKADGSRRAAAVLYVMQDVYPNLNYAELKEYDLVHFNKRLISEQMEGSRKSCELYNNTK